MRALGLQVKKAEVVKFVHELDPVNEGEVSMDLFMRLMAERYSARDPEEEVMKAFQLFDAEGIGSINIRSLKSIARELGETLSDDELQAMIDEFDKDQDGEINAEEFKYIMTQSSSY
jgi:centrin-3